MKDLLDNIAIRFWWNLYRGASLAVYPLAALEEIARSRWENRVWHYWNDRPEAKAQLEALAEAIVVEILAEKSSKKQLDN